MRLVAALVVTGLTLAACGPGEAPPIGDDDGGAPDAPGEQMSGLLFRFDAENIGQELDGVTIERVELYLREIRALGDAAPGDERTSLDEKRVRFPPDSDPNDIRFDQAPAGIYSSFELVAMGAQDADEAWLIEGTVDLGEETVDFVVEDDVAQPIELELGFDLAPGAVAEVPVHVDIWAVIEDIDWANAPRSDDEILIDDDFDGIEAIRTRFGTSFSIGDITVQ